MNLWLTLSAGSLLLPGIISIFKQPFIVTVVIINSCLFSLLYHTSNEENYLILDSIWAVLLSLVAMAMLLTMALTYGLKNWRVISASMLSIAALLAFFIHGYAENREDIEGNEKYVLAHTLWHILSTLAITILVTTKIDYAYLRGKYAHLYRTPKHMYENWYNGDPQVKNRDEKVGTKSGDRPGTKSEDRPGTKSEDRPGTKIVDRPGTKSVDRPVRKV
jgi:hypothetical protein